MESSSSGSSKRPRALNNPIQVPTCLVDGCLADLSKCRDYHRRHKVCEIHSKSPKVTIASQEMRFCQQCSRFHSIVEFDEGKRSCRKRLDGHNRRRRKPQPGSLPLNSGRFLSNHQGTMSLPFSNPNIFPSSDVLSSSWAAPIKPETENASGYNNNSIQLNFAEGKTIFLGSTSHDYNKGGKQFPFLQETCSVSQHQLLGSNSSSGLNHMVDSSSALSLLSSKPTGTWEIGVSHVAQSETFQITSCDSLLSSGVSTGGNNTQQQGQGVFGTGQESDGNQRISFSWE